MSKLHTRAHAPYTIFPDWNKILPCSGPQHYVRSILHAMRGGFHQGSSQGVWTIHVSSSIFSNIFERESSSRRSSISGRRVPGCMARSNLRFDHSALRSLRPQQANPARSTRNSMDVTPLEKSSYGLPLSRHLRYLRREDTLLWLGELSLSSA